MTGAGWVLADRGLRGRAVTTAGQVAGVAGTAFLTFLASILHAFSCASRALRSCRSLFFSSRAASFCSAQANHGADEK